MRHYPLSYWEIMALPIRAFWTLNRNINRLMAEEDLRGLMLHTSCQHGESAVAYDKKLRAEIFPEEALNRLEEKRDEGGFAWLKATAGQNRGAKKQ